MNDSSIPAYYYHIPTKEAETCITASRRFFTASQEARTLFFTPSFAGDYVASRTFAIDRMLGHSWQLLLTLQGEGIFETDSGDVRLCPGTVLFHSLAQQHRYRAAEDGWAFKYLHFRGAMSEQYYDAIHARHGNVITPDARTFLSLLEHTDTILAGMETPGLHAAAALSLEIYAMLTALIACGERSGVTDAQLTAVTEAAAYIRAHFTEPLSVSDLAARCYLSRPYFSKLFTRLVGTSPHEYLLLCRMSEAGRLLAETTLPIADVGEAAGFPDASVFTRIFSRYHGMPPSQYRRKMK